MTNPNDPAFSPSVLCGISKLEYFAAMAMIGLLQYSTLDEFQVAETAISQAKKLINELNKDL